MARSRVPKSAPHQKPIDKRIDGEALPMALKNREDGRFSVAEDGFIQLAKLGEWYHAKFDIIQVVDAAACDAILASFAKLKESAGANFTGLLVDRDHFSHQSDAPTEAFGWIEEMEKREDGVWGKVRWTSLGLEQIEGGVYRLVSPVFSDMEWLEGPRCRPHAITRVALTNDPNMRGMVPVANRDVPANLRAKICRILGIEESADDRALTDALDEWEKDQINEESSTMTPEETEKMNRLQSSVDALTGKITELTTENEALKASAAEVRNRQVADALTEFAEEIGDKKEVWKNRLEKDLVGTKDVLVEIRTARAASRRQIADPANREQRPMHKAGNGTKPENQDADGRDVPNAADVARARRVGILATDILNKNPKKTRAQAFREADAMIPRDGQEVAAGA